ncbi:peptide deformylase [Patescibacteria group bacterium]|nr:peptide deformylase [Patescibacteria group bacterium]
MRKIVEYPQKILRKKAKVIKKADKIFLEEANQLKEILEKSENGAGLAGPQIGVSKRMFAIKNEDKVRVFLNPLIKKKIGKRVYPIIEKEDERKEYFLEGCLSFPNFFGRVKRWLEIEVEWQEVRGGALIKKNIVLKSFEAIVWQHERDHLDGILFIDHIRKDGGKFFKMEAGVMKKWKLKKGFNLI